MKATILNVILVFSALIDAVGQIPSEIDGSEFYGKPKGTVRCERIPCVKKYKSFVGTWSGPFEAYDRQTRKFRPYRNSITYKDECYSNLDNGDIFIVGERLDEYDAFEGQASKISKGLLITGLAGGREDMPFLRTIDSDNGVVDYKKKLSIGGIEMSIWEYTHKGEGSSPNMLFTLVDFRDVTNSIENRRNVYITMTIGPEEKPYWQGVIVKGHHTLK